MNSTAELKLTWEPVNHPFITNSVEAVFNYEYYLRANKYSWDMGKIDDYGNPVLISSSEFEECECERANTVEENKKRAEYALQQWLNFKISNQ